MNNKTFLFFFFTVFSSHLFSQININHWETVVKASQTWKYLPAHSQPAWQWNTSTFDDDNWLEGIGGFGYGDDDDTTPIDTVTTLYLRKQFEIFDTSIIAYAVLHADYDDAFIAYLNGVEIARSNIGVAGDIRPFDNFATYFHEAQMYQDGRPEYFEIDKTTLTQNLKEGTNTLAIQVHNESETSSDLSAIFFLSVGIKNSSQQYFDTPDWFEPPVFLTESNLPIVQINTSNQTILDDPKITAQMKITNNQNGINNINELPNEYNGQIGIELRGSSSQRRFTKKSYGLETRHPDGSNNNVSLFGMPEENDWILYGPFSDKTLLRNDLIFHLAIQMGQYAPRTQFCELIINQKYQGIYIFMEKIKRDKGRVDISKLRPEDITDDELTGGYILKIDKQTGSGGDGWFSDVIPPEYEDRNVFFQYEYPKSDEINSEQKNYIQQYIYNFESALFSDNFKDSLEGYRKYIDVKSFIDFFIANELTFNVDGYRLSTFMYKKKDSNGGKLHMGPIWDFNLSMGNGWDCLVQNQEGFMYDYNNRCSGTNFQIPFWWSRLLEDSWFQNQLNCTWKTYREGPLHIDSILYHFEKQVELISEAQKRNFIRWPILEVKVVFNFFLGKTYEAELDYVRDWLQKRVNWLDENMYGNCGPLADYRGDDLNSILYPNPVFEQTTFEYYLPQDTRVNIYLRDAQGKTIERIIEDQVGLTGFHQINISTSHLPPGIYFITLYAVNKKQTHKLVKVN